MPKCPACDMPLTSEEAKASQCPVCKAPMDGVAIKETSFHSDSQETPRANFTRCFFCGEHEPCETGYFRVGYVNYWLFLATQRWLKIRCQCCPGCRAAFVSTKWIRILIAISMFALPLLVCGGIYFPFIAANKDPNFQPGQPGAITAAFGTLCLPWLICIPIGFFLIRYMFTSRIRPRLDPDRYAQLETSLGGSWGMMPSIFYSQGKPWLDDDYTDAARL